MFMTNLRQEFKQGSGYSLFLCATSLFQSMAEEELPKEEWVNQGEEPDALGRRSSHVWTRL